MEVSSARWWIGDWLAYGEKVYGETYAQAVEATGRKTEDLMNMVYVSTAVPVSLRNENLSWNHHAAVAPLDDPKAQRDWLAAAEENNWSTRELREQIKAKQMDRIRKPPAVNPAPIHRMGSTCRSFTQNVYSTARGFLVRSDGREGHPELAEVMA